MKEIKLNNGVLYHGNSARVLKQKIADNTVDLIVTSPPYDNLRSYKGYSFPFAAIARQCARVLKPGGVLIWVVADATVHGSETGSSFEQALYFKKKCGLRLHDTMIFAKVAPIPGDHGPRYRGSFEYMFAFSKGKPKTFNPVPWKAKNKIHFGERFRLEKTGRQRLTGPANGTLPAKEAIGWDGLHPNIFFYQVQPGQNAGTTRHTAVFPQQLAEDQINTWTNPGDLVLDPFAGSGTTCRAAEILGRQFIGVDISAEYIESAAENIRHAEQNKGPLITEDMPVLRPVELDFE